MAVLRVRRTVSVPAARAFAAFASAESVGRWFTTKARLDFRPGGAYSNADGDRGRYLAIDPGRRILFTWDNPGHCPGTEVEVAFVPAGRGRCLVRIVHRRLASADHAAHMRTGWTWALASLRSWLERGRPVPFEEWERRRARRRG